MTNFRVVVAHNVSADSFVRWSSGMSELFYAHTFTVTADTPELACDLVWLLTNVDDHEHLRQAHPHLAEYCDTVKEYRVAGNRSLSMGDVLVITGLVGPSQIQVNHGAWTPAIVGWKQLTRIPEIDEARTPREAWESMVEQQQTDAASEQADIEQAEIDEHIDNDEAQTDCCATWRDRDDVFVMETPDGRVYVCAAGAGCNA